MKNVAKFTNGGMSKDELRYLETLCKGKTVLEVGSYTGQSSYVIAGVCKSLTCVDVWDDSFNHVDKAQRDVYLAKGLKSAWDEFNDNCKEYIESGRITVIRSMSSEAQIEGVYDIVFIDADHSYEGVRDDIAKYRPHAKRMAFHDYGGMWWGVKTAVDQTDLIYKGHVGTLYCFE